MSRFWPPDWLTFSIVFTNKHVTIYSSGIRSCHRDRRNKNVILTIPWTPHVKSVSSLFSVYIFQADVEETARKISNVKYLSLDPSKVLNLLKLGLFLDRFLLWKGVKLFCLIFFFGASVTKDLKGQEFSGMGCLKIFWVRAREGRARAFKD